MGREAWIGNTDQTWFEYLRAIGATRVNFWYPSPTPEPVQRLARGDPFYFRLKDPINKIGGGGRLENVLTLTIDKAWEEFGQANGTPTRDHLIALIAAANRRNGRSVGGAPESWEIGCVILRDCVFLPDHGFLPQPALAGTALGQGRHPPPRPRHAHIACIRRAGRTCSRVHGTVQLHHLRLPRAWPYAGGARGPHVDALPGRRAAPRAGPPHRRGRRERLSLTSHSVARLFGKDPYPWDPGERYELDVLVDALVAHAYRLTRDQYEIVLDSFEVMAREQIRRFGSYRFRSDCLRAYDRVARGG